MPGQGAARPLRVQGSALALLPSRCDHALPSWRVSSMADAALVSRLEAAVEANWERQVAWLQELVRFPSLRGKEGPCQDWIAREFAGRGWSVDRYTLDQVPM